MRVLKFKESTQTFHKGEIVVRPNNAPFSDVLYLLVEDVNPGDRTARVFHMGTLSHRASKSNELYASLIFNTKDNKPVTIRTNYDGYLSFRQLTQNEKELIFNCMTDKTYYDADHYLDIVKKATGLDVREIYKDEYDEYLMRKNADKYNL